MAEKKKIKIHSESEESKELDEAGDGPDAMPETSSKTGNHDTGKEATDPVAELTEKLDAKEKEAAESYDRYLRTSAEFDNYKKRKTREIEEFRKYANESLLKEMLSVVDNLKLALNSAGDNGDTGTGLVEGIQMTLKDLMRVFDKFRVKPIEAKGKPFNPEFHEAMLQEESDDYPENTVINEFQEGYMIHDRLLRPAMVVVAKPKTANDQSG